MSQVPQSSSNIPRAMVCGYLIPEVALEAYAARIKLPTVRNAVEAVTHVSRKLGLYPRVQPLLARGQKRDFLIVAVATNRRQDEMPMLETEEVQRLKDFFKLTDDPKWYPMSPI